MFGLSALFPRSRTFGKYHLGYLDKDEVQFNKVLFEVGGGISFSNGTLYGDVSYRFRKFLDTGEPINVSGIYAGVGVGF